ncbi:methylated-DNA--[protein]-cysteine S-methyltransferase [Slackia heliotrinireducens]|uniref:Methylated-DNA--protein-cysteine methyltransferase n=1 Tax=Slackia heliotrinireducens (strain ATCC 29202 / DSM 20476 / NCTC 11029 / RHS 1) TaxID=471855 RepID=C7N544_SLAHD|nr:methylated-DNA--[protein]-cysteine S-methyltransferase [Slackia heliotrinireducens]ACV22029.1 O-6-methylguanine DNA methyltransferase [Slackia heliotrinireducens DSM 20476]VEG99961.1 Methylated-DNA--protein-cysteine methyltransferase, constitutive [Slackia heliotrinireducens]
MNHFVYAMPQGRLTIVASETALTNIYFGVKELDMPFAPSKITNDAATQLQEYFAKKRTSFDLPIQLKGTPFQLEVWNALRDIPYGQTRTYAQIAETAGRPNAFRAVGSANNRNPLPIVVPCHRVVGSDGDLVGYAYGLKLKRFLLELEGVDVDGLKRR